MAGRKLKPTAMKKPGNRSAYQLFSFLHDESLLEKLGIALIPSKEINLTPLLLKK